jgi:REP element-mobilizing transposase RayT
MIEGGVYHVYNRFARGEEVFADPEEAVSFIDRLRHAKDRDGFVVFAWCLMSNHFHLALRTSSVPLSRTMHLVQNGFSREFNRRWRRTGPLWQSRYKAKLIDAQDYLTQVILYLERCHVHNCTVVALPAPVLAGDLHDSTSVNVVSARPSDKRGDVNLVPIRDARWQALLRRVREW